MNTLEALNLMKGKMVHYGLSHWSCGYNNRVRFLGLCKHYENRIELSHSFAALNAPERVLITILHEIAHARAGHTAGHGPIWAAEFLRLQVAEGIPNPKAERCATHGSFVPTPAPYKLVCKVCNLSLPRFKRVTKKQSCPKCCSVYNPAFLLELRDA